MIDWLTISFALFIIVTLIGIFGFVAWKINMTDLSLSSTSSKTKDYPNQFLDLVTDRKTKVKYANDQGKRKGKDQKRSKRNKETNQQRLTVKFKQPSTQGSEETDNEREESEQVNHNIKNNDILFCVII